MIKRTIFFLSVIVVCGCESFQRNEESALARVGSTYLYDYDLEALGLQEMSPEDSAQLTNAFIDSWVQQQLLVQKAIENLSPEQLSQTDSKVQNYRNSLLGYLYENELVAQKVNSTVSENQLDSYYENNKKEFELDGTIVRLIYVKTTEDIANADSLKMWLEAFPQKKNARELTEYCNYHAVECKLDPEIWVSLSAISETFQLTDGSNLSSLRNGRVYTLESSGYKYLCKIIEEKNRGSAPLSYVQDKIKEQIIREREQQFLKQLKVDMYDAALENNEIEIYDKE